MIATVSKAAQIKELKDKAWVEIHADFVKRITNTQTVQLYLMFISLGNSVIGVCGVSIANHIHLLHTAWTSQFIRNSGKASSIQCNERENYISMLLHFLAKLL